MNKKTFWWLFIGSNLMMVLSAVAAVLYQDKFISAAIGFTLSFVLFIISVIFLLEIKSVCFGSLRPHLGSVGFFLRKYYEDAPEKYIAVIKRILLILWSVGLVAFGEGVIVAFIKLLTSR